MSLSRLQRFLASASLIVLITGHTATGSRHETFAEFLKRHGIEVTEKGLVSALKNPDPEIRDNAAQELADRKAAAAIPAITGALAVEKDPELQVNLAYALARLGDRDGFVALQHFCDTASASPRLKAALYLLTSFNDESCFGAVESVLQSESERDHAFVVNAMSLVPRFHQLPASDEQRLIVLTVKQLEDPDATVRMTASEVLAKVGDAAVVPSLQKAIADETDQVARSWMQRELGK
jgi:HEAT repeat protein